MKISHSPLASAFPHEKYQISPVTKMKPWLGSVTEGFQNSTFRDPYHIFYTCVQTRTGMGLISHLHNMVTIVSNNISFTRLIVNKQKKTIRLAQERIYRNNSHMWHRPNI